MREDRLRKGRELAARLRRAAYTPRAIRQKLAAAGWSDADVREVLTADRTRRSQRRRNAISPGAPLKARADDPRPHSQGRSPAATCAIWCALSLAAAALWSSVVIIRWLADIPDYEWGSEYAGYGVLAALLALALMWFGLGMPVGISQTLSWRRGVKPGGLTAFIILFDIISVFGFPFVLGYTLRNWTEGSEFVSSAGPGLLGVILSVAILITHHFLRLGREWARRTTMVLVAVAIAVVITMHFATEGHWAAALFSATAAVYLYVLTRESARSYCRRGRVTRTSTGMPGAVT